MSPEERALHFSREAFRQFGLSETDMAEYAAPIASLIRAAENEALERAAKHILGMIESLQEGIMTDADIGPSDRKLMNSQCEALDVAQYEISAFKHPE